MMVEFGTIFYKRMMWISCYCIAVLVPIFMLWDRIILWCSYYTSTAIFLGEYCGMVVLFFSELFLSWKILAGWSIATCQSNLKTFKYVHKLGIALGVLGSGSAERTTTNSNSDRPSASLFKDLHVLPLLSLSQGCEIASNLFDLAPRTSHLGLCRSVFTCVCKVFDENARWD
jgi:hypothetical protein